MSSAMQLFLRERKVLTLCVPTIRDSHISVAVSCSLHKSKKCLGNCLPLGDNDFYVQNTCAVIRLKCTLANHTSFTASCSDSH